MSSVCAAPVFLSLSIRQIGIHVLLYWNHLKREIVSCFLRCELIMSTFARGIVFVLIIALILMVKLHHRELIQKYNVYKLTSEGLDERIVPHRINYIDKLYRVLDDDIRSLEVDLIFRTAGRYGFFEIGHDENDATGVNFDLFLAIFRNYEMKKIWLDIKNINDQNIDAVIAELERLDSIYNFRDISIIESSNTTSDNLQMLGSRKFHTSYYLPTEKILLLLGEHNEKELDTEAKRIQQQIFKQSLSALSFDLRLYPYVKNYVEPGIPEDIVYHAWNSVKLYELSSLNTLKSSDYYMDPRIKTILVRYHHEEES